MPRAQTLLEPVLLGKWTFPLVSCWSLIQDSRGSGSMAAILALPDG